MDNAGQQRLTMENADKNSNRKLDVSLDGTFLSH